MKNLLLKFSIISIFLSFFIITIPIYAANNHGAVGSPAPGQPVTLDNPLPDGTTPQSLIGNIIKAAMGIIGSLALAMFIYGGFVWMTAAGNAERVKQGKDILIWATLGLVAIFASYSIISFLIKNLG